MSQPLDGSRTATEHLRILRSHRRRYIRPNRVTHLWLSASTALPQLSFVSRLSGERSRSPSAVRARSRHRGSAVRQVRHDAGLLQLFLGVFGIGRFYIDSTQIAIAQLCLGLFGFVFSLSCLFGVPVLLGSIVRAIVDAIMMFTGSVKDNGRASCASGV